MATASHTLDQLEREIEAEFVDETRDALYALEVMLGNFESGMVSASDALSQLRRSFLSLEVRSQSVDNAPMTILAHRASEYASDLREFGRDMVSDVQTFIDAIRRQIDHGGNAAEVVRQLPFRRIVDFDISEAIKKLNIEIMLVIPDRAIGRFVERELAACGYRASNARSFFRGLETAVRTQPNMVIAAAVLEELSGIDLARALSSISATAKIPFALLTSYERDHPSLADLPDSVAIVRKGPQFGEDIADALSRFKII